MMKRVYISKRKRIEIFNRDDFTCQYCGAFGTNIKLHVDHVLAASRGGTNDDDNLATACSHCNLSKSNKHAASWKHEIIASLVSAYENYMDYTEFSGGEIDYYEYEIEKQTPLWRPVMP